MWTAELPQPSDGAATAIREIGPLLKYLREGPQPLLRARSVTLLAAYLNGFVRGCKALHGDIKFDPELEEFEEWLRNQFARQRDWSRLKWHCIIKYLSDSRENEARAFDAFFSLIDQWQTERGIPPNSK